MAELDQWDDRPAFAVTVTGPHTARAVRINVTGEPRKGAPAFDVCRHCFTARRGGGVIVDEHSCSNGCGLTAAPNPEED